MDKRGKSDLEKTARRVISNFMKRVSFKCDTIKIEGKLREALAEEGIEQ